jgi:hypothetical protein
VAANGGQRQRRRALGRLEARPRAIRIERERGSHAGDDHDNATGGFQLQLAATSTAKPPGHDATPVACRPRARK